MDYDVVIVGAGPSGLACAIKIKQLAQKANCDITVAILEKGSNVGSNIISGCVMDPTALTELIPEWEELNFPLKTKVVAEEIKFLTKNSSLKLPHLARWGNHGNYLISLSQLCKELGEYAQNLGVEIYPGVAVKSAIIDNGIVKGVITNDSGVLKDGSHGSNYQSGFAISAKQVVLAEGARGSLTKEIIQKFNLDATAEAQTYGLGIKEVWQIDRAKSVAGKISHYIGYPLQNNAYGGGFLYHLADNLVAVGLVTALDYQNPYLNPYQEFQKFKLHRDIAQVLTGGKRLEYGARVITEGGIQSLIKPTFKGGIIIGDALGLVNVPKIKGVNYAIKSGMIAAETLMPAIANNEIEVSTYKTALYDSYIYTDLYQVRNFRPAFKWGLFIGLMHAWVDYIFKGKLPYTLKHGLSDNEKTLKKNQSTELHYIKVDNKISFERQNALAFSNISFDDTQICHLKLQNPDIPIKINLAEYAAPESRYCPAGVYEIIEDNKTLSSPYRLQINPANCLHCKACDIKDPMCNITWTVPEGGSGPQYSLM
jgi:electron-transferring-flavoprotein dehydrogenase